MLITMCFTWSADKNWNLSLSFTRSHIRGFCIWEMFVKHQHHASVLTPLWVPLDSIKKKVSTISESSLNTISSVSTSKLKRKCVLLKVLSHFTQFVSWLQSSWKYCVEVVTVLGDLWMTGYQYRTQYISVAYPDKIVWWLVLVCRSGWFLQQHHHHHQTPPLPPIPCSGETIAASVKT